MAYIVIVGAFRCKIKKPLEKQATIKKEYEKDEVKLKAKIITIKVIIEENTKQVTTGT